MPIDPLTLTVATVLATKALESVGGEAGRSAWSGIGRLVELVRRRFVRDPQATTALERAQEAPQDGASVERLAEALQNHIAQDLSFSHELTTWVEEACRHPTLGGLVTQISGQVQAGTIITGQVVHVSMVQPSLAVSTQAVPAQLPPDVAEFTGREVELARLRALVSDGAAGGTVVISAIAGTAGVGKTALAVHLAHELVPRFSDGQLYVNLHGYDPVQRLGPAQALDRFLRALGVADEALPADPDEQSALYRTLLDGKHVLVVLDNASSPDQVRPLLPASPTCLALVTSRDSLAGLVAQNGARLLNLDVLSPAEAVELLARVAGYQVDREPAVAAEVARMCGHLPLAVRIVAAKLTTRPGWTLADLAKRLADEQRRLHELMAGDVQVRTSFALSYESLDPAIAQMFHRLGLITGPDFTAGVAAVLTDTTREEAETLLEALVDAHLLEPGLTPERYRFHDLLRLYARECLQIEERNQDRTAALRRMQEWYLDTAEAADRVLIPGRRRLPRNGPSKPSEYVFATRAHALAWFEAERASLVAAIYQAADCSFHPVTWQLADALWSFFDMRKHWEDWQDTHRVGLAAAQQAQDRRAEAWMLTSLGVAHKELRRFDEAIDCYEQALAIGRGVVDRHIECRTLANLGILYRELRRFDEAITWHQESLAIARELGDRDREALNLHNFGEVYCLLGRFEEAFDHYQQSLAIARELGDRYREGRSLGSLGEVYRQLRRFDQAVDHFQQALAIRREVGDRWGEGETLHNLGLALRHTQGIEAARACWREAFAIFTALGAPEVDEVRARFEQDDRGPR